jgi:kumamolisin
VLSFYFGLKRPESRAVSAYFAVQRPGSASYRRFLTPRQIAQIYGATPTTKAAFSRGMRRLGLSVRVDPSGVFARVSGTQHQLQRAFHVRITGTYDDFATSYQATGRLRLPAGIRSLVREVIPFYARTTRSPSSILPPGPHLGAPGAPTNAGTWIGGCKAARALGAYSFAQVRHAYRLDQVGSGAGASVAILNDQEGVTSSDIAQNASCFGLPANRVRTLFTQGQTRPFGFQSFEPHEDLALVRGIAPQLRSVLLTPVWGSTQLWFLGAAKLLTERKLPDALTISYGYCERQFLAGDPDRQGSELLNSLFVRLGLAGVGVFGSAGDSGSTCNGAPLAGVAWPAVSPYVTVVGGSRLVVNKSNRCVSEVVWNDLQWLSPSNGGGAGGGGLSSFYARPAYQRGLPVPGSRRAVPDIAVHASMLPGYPVFGAGHWLEDAGTSAASPLAAAAFAVISAKQQAAHRPPLGPVNGLLYWLRRHRPGALYDIVSGSNGYAPNIPGYQAKRGYDLASGLGVPRFDRIAAQLPRPDKVR